MSTKKLNNKIESANEVTNNNEQTEKEQFVKKNLHLVPTVMKSRFQKMDLESQYTRMQHYVEMQKLREENASLTKIASKVKQLFISKKANSQDAHSVIEFCKKYIDTCKEKELAEINEQIAKLQTLKENLESSKNENNNG